MSELGSMTGAAKTVEIRGKEYKITPLTLEDLADFEDFIKKERKKETIESLKEAGLSENILADKIIEISKKSIGLDEVNEFMSTMTGVKRLLFVVLKKHQKDIKEEDMGKLVTLDNFEEVGDIISELGGKAVEKQAKNARKGKSKK